MEKRYLINGEVYKGSEMPKPCYKVIWDEEGDNDLADWKHSLVKLACDKEEILKIRKSIYYSNKEHQGYKFEDFIKKTIDITSITEVSEKSYCKKCEKTAESCVCEFDSDESANKNTYIKSKVYFNKVESKSDLQLGFNITVIESPQIKDGNPIMYMSPTDYKNYSDKLKAKTT